MLKFNNFKYLSFSLDLPGLGGFASNVLNYQNSERLRKKVTQQLQPDLSTPEGIKSSLNNDLGEGWDNKDTSYLSDPTFAGEERSESPFTDKEKNKIINDYEKQRSKILGGSESLSLSLKFENSTLGQNVGAINKGLDSLGTITNAFGKDPYSTPNGDLRSAVDNGYNAIADTAALFGPYGQMVSMGMKAANVLNGIQGAIFGATDGMTKTDAIMDSPLGFLTGVGWINQAFGLKSDTITKNDEAFAQVGGSFGGSNFEVDEALKRSGKKYGAFSSSARKDANAEIAAAKSLQNSIERIGEESATRNTLQASMSSINSNSRNLAMQGGYQLNTVHVGKYGMRFQRAYEITHKPKITEMKKGGTFDESLFIKEPIDDFKYQEAPDDWFLYEEAPEDYTVEIFQKGGKTKSEYEEWLESVPESRRNPNYDLKMAFEVTPREEMDTWKNATDEDLESGKYHLYSVSPVADEKGRFPFLKLGRYPENQELEGEIKAYLSGEIPELSNYGLHFENDRYYYVPKNPEYFKKGGSFNIIPEGALHARKHNLDIEGITKKGIPVVSESEGGELVQQAEIEHSEIILRLAVTKKIESAMKKYNSKDISKSEKDEIAIEIGKLLTNEILNNTDDRTLMLTD